jgi:hypothetical protein
MRHLEIRLDPLGFGTVILDGIRISQYTDGFEMSSYVGATTVKLSLAKGVSLDFAQAIPKLEIEGDCPHCGQRIAVTGKMMTVVRQLKNAYGRVRGFGHFDRILVSGSGMTPTVYR